MDSEDSAPTEPAVAILSNNVKPAYGGYKPTISTFTNSIAPAQILPLMKHYGP